MAQAQIDQQKIVIEITEMSSPDENELKENLEKVEQKDLQD